MGEVVSGLRFRKNHIVPQPTHPRGLHDQRGSPDPTGGDPHPGLSWSCAITRTREDDHSGPCIDCTITPTCAVCTTSADLLTQPGGILTPDYVNDSIIYMYIQ